MMPITSVNYQKNIMLFLLLAIKIDKSIDFYVN